MVAVINPISNLQTVYISMYGRPADPQGLAYWNNITSNGTNLAPMVQFFAVSPEFVSLFGPAFAPNAPVAPSTNDIQVAINQVYQQAFGRDADPAGLTYWTEQIQSGKVNATEFAMIIVQEAQPADAAIVAAKLGTADSFTASINTTAELLQYPTEVGLDAGRAFLAPVVSVATQPTQAQIDAQLALIANGDTAAGQTFTLTTGVDTFTGTAGNDTFQAELGGNDTTITTFDNINGAGGFNTLNIVGGAGGSVEVNPNATFANVQVVNVDVAAPITNLNSASFGGVQQLWQIGNESAVTVGAGVVAGFRNIESPQFLDVRVTDAQSASVAFDNVVEGQTLAINGSSGTTLNSVNILGAVLDADDDGIATVSVDVYAGAGVQTVSVNSAVDVVLDVFGTSAAPVTTVDASASAGDIEFGFGMAPGLDAIATIKSGVGNDNLALRTLTVADNVATAAVETVSGLVDSGAGDDQVDIVTTGTGATTVNSGAGNDAVFLVEDGDGKLAVALGDGNDAFEGDVASAVVLGTDTIDGGAGTDTLQLNLVGSVNVGAFSNFEAFDVVGLTGGFDADILAAQNVVGEFVASGSVGAGAAIVDLAAGDGYRVTESTNTNALSLTQKVGGALSVTLDVDESIASTVATSANASVNALNSTSVNVVFSSDFVDAASGSSDNVAELKLNTYTATAVTVSSGGTNASNVLILNDVASGTDKLATITVTGAEAFTLDLSTNVGSVLTSINASAQTGGLTASLAALKDGGNISLGSGTDTITANSWAAPNAAESVTGFEKAAAVAVSTASADTLARNAAIEAADTLVVNGVDVALNSLVGTATIANGVLTFTGAGPSTLAAAVLIAEAAIGPDQVTVFQYASNSYIFGDDGVNDTLVQLVGVTGVTHLGETGTDQFFIV